jgi:hypothetical protein
MPALADGRNSVPFAAALAGEAVWDGGPIANCRSEGIATHLGQTTSQCTAELDLNAYGPYDICSGEGENGYGIPNVNTLRLTAANGDLLVLVSDDIACQIEQFSFRGTGEWIVDSEASTGRFAGATGVGELGGQVDFAAGVVQVSIVGEISY